MNANKNNADEAALIGRLLGHQQEKGASFEDATQTVRDALPDELKSHLDTIEQLAAKEPGSVITKSESRFPELMSKLSVIVHQENGDSRQLFLYASPYLLRTQSSLHGHLQSLGALLVYLGAGLTIALGITILFSSRVLPAFEYVFSSFGAQLPPLTTFVLAHQATLSWLLIILLAIVIVWAVSLEHLKRRSRRLLSPIALIRRLPGLRAIVDLFGYFLFLQYTKALRASGVSDDATLEHALRLAGIEDPSGSGYSLWIDGLRAAGKTQCMEQELQYQSEQIDTLLQEQITRTRRIIAISMQTGLAIIIGGLVIAMYLPIFQLGSAI